MVATRFIGPPMHQLPSPHNPNANTGDYVNPDADAESVLVDLEGVLSQLRDLSTACDTYKEYQVRRGTGAGPLPADGRSWRPLGRRWVHRAIPVLSQGR